MKLTSLLILERIILGQWKLSYLHTKSVFFKKQITLDDIFYLEELYGFDSGITECLNILNFGKEFITSVL